MRDDSEIAVGKIQRKMVQVERRAKTEAPWWERPQYFPGTEGTKQDEMVGEIKDEVEP